MNKFSRFLGLLSEDSAIDTSTKIGRVLLTFAELVDEFLVPFIIAIGSIGVAYGIWLGVAYAKAEGDGRVEAKKRIINFLIGLISVLVLIVLLIVYVKNAESLISWIEESILGGASLPTGPDPNAGTGNSVTGS